MASTTVIGIDIGTYSVKCAQLEAHTKGFSISGYHEYILDQDPNRDRQIQIVEVLRTIAASRKPDSTRYVFCLPQDKVSVRFKNFPFRERGKILKSVPYELEDDIPLDQDDAIFDAKVVRFNQDKTDVLACAAPKTQISELLELARECGIEPDIISLEGFAFANTVEDFWAAPSTFDGQQTPATLHLHMGHSSTIVSAYQNAKLIGIRSIFWGGKQIAENIARKFQIPFIEALKVLQTKSFILLSNEGASRDQIVFSQTITQAFDSLIHELRLTILEFKTELNVDFQQAFISGGISQIPHLSAYLTQGLELPVNIYNHLSRYPQSYLDQDSTVPFASNIAIGLALEGVKKPRNPALNFRREEFGKQSQTMQNLWHRWNYAVKVAGVALLVFYVYAPLRDNLASSLVDSASENLHQQAKMIAHLTGSRAGPSGVRRFVNDQKKKIRARETMGQVQALGSALDVLKKFNDLVPRRDQVQLDIRHLMIQKDTLVVQGEVANARQLELLKNSVASLAVDRKVNIDKPGFAPSPAKVGFSFRLHIAHPEKGTK